MIFLTQYKGSTTWSDFMSRPSSGGMSIGDAFAMLLLDTVIYALLAYYFDYVMPNEFGVSHKPWFFLQPSFWRGQCSSQTTITDDEEVAERVAKDVSDELTVNSDVETVETSYAVSHVGIVTQNLCKHFGGGFTTSGNLPEKLAVDHLSLAVYKNEITAILGHNGAGKTTTIRMLTGQTAPSSGTAYVIGHNICTAEGLKYIQANLGIAAQENILWPSLTVGQHLQIFGRLKAMTSTEIKTDSIHLLAQLDLQDKLNNKSDQLSGGQKRRLCLAIALIGSPQVIHRRF